jgi:ribosomal protein L18E
LKDLVKDLRYWARANGAPIWTSAADRIEALEKQAAQDEARLNFIAEMWEKVMAVSGKENDHMTIYDQSNGLVVIAHGKTLREVVDNAIIATSQKEQS